MACEIITPQRAEGAAMMAINISCFILFYLKHNDGHHLDQRPKGFWDQVYVMVMSQSL